MKYRCTGEGQSHETDDLLSLEQVLSVEPRFNSAQLRIELPISLEGQVRRNDTGSEEVVLASDHSVRTFVRQTCCDPDGDICVSCDPNGSEVPVQSINLPFRVYNDTLTNRGIVRVIPGQPATMMIELYPNRFGESDESITQIIAAAEAKVRDKVLHHFVN